MQHYMCTYHNTIQLKTQITKKTHKGGSTTIANSYVFKARIALGTKLLL